MSHFMVVQKCLLMSSEKTNHFQKIENYVRTKELLQLQLLQAVPTRLGWKAFIENVKVARK